MSDQEEFFFNGNGSKRRSEPPAAGPDELGPGSVTDEVDAPLTLDRGDVLKGKAEGPIKDLIDANFLEYATAMNPAANDKVSITAQKNGNMLEFIYTKNKAATDVTYTVEWSDDLVNWDNAGVTSSLLTDGATTQQIKALVPAGLGDRWDAMIIDTAFAER